MTDRKKVEEGMRPSCENRIDRNLLDLQIAGCQIIIIIIHSKYFPDSDWLKAHA